MTESEPVEARDLTAEEEAKARTYLRRAPGTENVEAWRRWASNLTWAVPLYADKMWATIDALRADTARVPEGLDVKRMALAIMAADLFESDGIPPGRWDLYAESIAKRIVVGDARARAALERP